MLIGIDVGGTTTDAVLIHGRKVVKTAIVPTDHQNILRCLMEALDKLIEGIHHSDIKRVVLSTTLITNLIAEGKAEKVGLVLIPGPGTNPADYRFTGEGEVLGGAIDYRGREIQPLDETEIKLAASKMAGRDLKKVAIVGKFSQRNHAHELKVNDIFNSAAPGLKTELGHRISGQLNFPRRAATTMLTAATRDAYQSFVAEANAALLDRRITAPVYILKADGGTLPLDRSVDMPVETIFSGPAASIMGVLALVEGGQTSVVVDIGGTTTDLALILDGKPLMASKGAKVDGMYTHIRAFAVSSVGLGGDSAVRVDEQGKIKLGPDRAGPPFSVGGPLPTPTDAIRVLGLSDYGDLKMAISAMSAVAKHLGLSSPEEASQQVIQRMVDMITSKINEMFEQWESEPAYRIWEILQKESIRPQNVVGVGGGSPPIVPLVAARLKAKGLVLEHAPVANAIGAAVARPTMTINLRIDTDQGVYTVAEDGTVGQIKGRGMNQDEALKMARDLLVKRAEHLGISEYASDAEVTHSEVFNMVRGWSTAGKLIDVRMEIPAGIIKSWEGGS